MTDHHFQSKAAKQLSVESGKGGSTGLSKVLVFVLQQVWRRIITRTARQFKEKSFDMFLLESTDTNEQNVHNSFPQCRWSGWGTALGKKPKSWKWGSRIIAMTWQHVESQWNWCLLPIYSNLDPAWLLEIKEEVWASLLRMLPLRADPGEVEEDGWVFEIIHQDCAHNCCRFLKSVPSWSAEKKCQNQKFTSERQLKSLLIKNQC